MEAHLRREGPVTSPAHTSRHVVARLRGRANEAFAAVFLDLHRQRLLAAEDPAATFTAAQAQAWVERAAGAINAFLSAGPAQRRSFALEILLRPPGAEEPAG